MRLLVITSEILERRAACRRLAFGLAFRFPGGVACRQWVGARCESLSLVCCQLTSFAERYGWIGAETHFAAAPLQLVAEDPACPAGLGNLEIQSIAIIGFPWCRSFDQGLHRLARQLSHASSSTDPHFDPHLGGGFCGLLVDVLGWMVSLMLCIF